MIQIHQKLIVCSIQYPAYQLRMYGRDKYDNRSQNTSNLINSWNVIINVLATNFSYTDKCDKEPSFGI